MQRNFSNFERGGGDPLIEAVKRAAERSKKKRRELSRDVEKGKSAEELGISKSKRDRVEKRNERGDLREEKQKARARGMNLEEFRAHKERIRDRIAEDRATEKARQEERIERLARARAQMEAEDAARKAAAKKRESEHLGSYKIENGELTTIREANWKPNRDEYRGHGKFTTDENGKIWREFSDGVLEDPDLDSD